MTEKNSDPLWFAGNFWKICPITRELGYELGRGAGGGEAGADRQIGGNDAEELRVLFFVKKGPEDAALKLPRDAAHRERAAARVPSESGVKLHGRAGSP